jgi:hypothetical protein
MVQVRPRCEVAILVSVAVAYISSFVWAVIADGDAGQPPMLSVENDVGYPISIGFFWDVFGFAPGIVLCSFTEVISVVFRAPVDAIRAILISGALLALPSGAGLELMSRDPPLMSASCSQLSSSLLG